jgi:integrase
MSGVIFPRIGNIEATVLNHKELTKYVNGRINDGVKKTTIHRELSDIRAILNWAEKERFIAESPFKGFKMPRRDDSFIPPTTDSEFEAIIKNAAPHVVRAMLVSYYTGLRPGVSELFTLKWDNIDWNEQTITIISAEKGGLPVRTVPINPHLLSWLKKWAIEDAAKGIESIVHYRGKKINTSMKTAWRSAIRRAGIKKRIRPYSMRHKTVSDMLSNGADLKSTAEIVGHKDTRTTMQIYQQTTNRMKREAVGMLGKSPLKIEISAPDENTRLAKNK